MNIRLKLFNLWLDDPSMGSRFIYHRGELARDAEHDPDLAAVAFSVRAVSNGRFDTVSKCGHVRGEEKGTGLIEALSRRERGELVHFARRLAA